MKKFLAFLAVVVILSGCVGQEKHTIVVMETGMGTIKIKLYDEEVPKTVANFKKLVKDGFYDGLIFHRIVRNFVIQGGAFYPDGKYKESPYGTIPLEISNKLKHVDGAVGMARADDPDSASSQFYICVGEHHNLDGSYAVFGKVIEGMDVVRAINKFDPEHTKNRNGMANWPDEDIIDKVTIIRAYIES